MNITFFAFTIKHLTFSFYFTTRWQGIVNAWPQKRTDWKWGFVLRFLLLGFVIRVGHKPPPKRWNLPLGFFDTDGYDGDWWH